MTPDDAVAYEGKKLCDLSREEAIACAAHFHAAHVEMFNLAANLIRRMRFLEEALPPAKVRELDDWWQAHPTSAIHDAQRGDGKKLYIDWQQYYWWEKLIRFS